MGAKTVKRLAILLATILVAALSIFFIQRYQVVRMDRSVLARAAQAEKDGNFEEAVRFYQEHFEVVPDDQDAKLKYGDVLLKGTKNLAHQKQAAQLYAQIVTRSPANKDVRRRLAELTVEIGDYNEARQHLELLLKSEPNDGALHFLLGRCREAIDPDRAVDSFNEAIKNNAPQRLEAYSRQATLLRTRHNKSKDGAVKVEADKVIEEANQAIEAMVASDPENYQVYLERGRYRRQFGRTPEERKGAKDDFQVALKKGPNDPKVYTELAALARSSKNDEEARQVLEAGLKILPNEPTLHRDLAMLEIPGSIDKAIMSLRRSLEILPDQAELHMHLAYLLAQRGDTSELLMQIGELKRLNVSPILTGFLEAKHLTNSNEWKKATQALIKLQVLVEQSPDYKARVNDLLAQCYHHLGDREREREAYRRSVRANQQDMQARWGLAASLVARGEIDAAINEYRQLVDQLLQEQREAQLPPKQLEAQLPPIRGQLVRLLIARNQQRTEEQRDWTEVDKLIKMANESAPQSSEWVILQTEFLLAQNKIAEAQALLDEARLRSPRDVDLWVKSAEVLRRQRKFNDARNLLDQAKQSLGDSVELRLERSRQLTIQGGADLPKALGALAENSASFSRADRRRLLEVLAQEAARLNDRSLVTDLWSQVARLDPNDLEPQLHLLDLAFQAKNKADIENRINEIKRIEGAEGLTARYGHILYQIWQAKNTTDRQEQEELRKDARSKLNDLGSQRSDWPKIPLAQAELVEQELSQPDLSEDKKKSKQNEAAGLYLRAIELGQRDPGIIRRATDLLYATDRKAEVTQLWTQLPTTTIAGSDLQRQVSVEALRNRDYEGALDLARKAKAANPNDFRESLLLVQMLIANQRQAEAETELREAVDATPADPDRWLALVQFLAMTKQMEKAEKAAHDAESALKQKPLGPARCCEVLGRTFKAAGQDDEKTKAWFDRAGRWYTAARNAKPNDFMVVRQYIDFLFRSGQSKDVESQLTTILENKNRVDDPKNAEEMAWARRTLASTLLASRDAEQSRKALALVEPMEQATVGQQKGDRPPRKPEDLRVLAKVYEAQGTPAFHKKARDVLEEMVGTNVADPEDRFMLALMYSNDGDWGNAHEQYRKLLAQTENTSDLEVFKRRPDYIAQFIDELLKRYQGDQNQEGLSEAQDLIEKLKTLSPNAFNVVAFEARLYKAQNQIDKAVELIQASAKRPNLSDPLWQALANLADELGQAKLAEDLLRQSVEKSNRPQNRLALATFLGRHGRVKEALDQCEQLWKGTTDPEELVRSTLAVLLSSSSDHDKAQVDRVAGWMQKGLEQKPKSSVLVIALGNLRERQGRFQEAEALYAQEIKQGQGDPIALNNLAWLMALRNGDGSVALDLINRAIARRGPLPELLDTRGVIYTMLGKSQNAIEDLNRATTLDPTGPKYFHLAQAYLRASNKQAAAQTLAKARSKGLTQDSLHPLEVTAYQQVLSALGTR
jgi:cellulose synthase operon protein C